MNKYYVVAAVVGVVSSACGAPAVSKELRTAREAYTAAQMGPAQRLNPTGLYEAKGFLVLAEKAHEDDPGSAVERANAYVAERRVQLAVSKANEVASKEQQTAADEQFKTDLVASAERSKSQSKDYADQLKDAKGDIAVSEQGRAAAEKRAQEALLALQRLAAVKQEQNRVTITLSGSVLFRSGSSDLLDVARERLKAVAEALSAYGNAPIVVLGHTDSRGSDESNQVLSQGRADAVRGYLISQGLQSGSIQAVGRGESQPIAGNETPEGQSSNRRVEIVVDQSPTALRGAPSGGTQPAAFR